MTGRHQRPLERSASPLRTDAITIVHQKGPQVPLNVRVPEELRRELHVHCVEQHCRIEEFVAEAIREALQRRERG